MDQGVSGSVATRPNGRSSSGKSGPSSERKSGATTRPGPGRPSLARTDQSRPQQRPGLVPGTTRPAPCAAPLASAMRDPHRRPWALGMERLTVPPAVHASIEDAVLAFVRERVARPVPSSVVMNAAPRRARVAEIAFSTTIGALAVLLALAVVSTLLPGVTAAGAVGIGFLAATGGFAGYSSWRWLRWMRNRAERLHWSVIAAAGAATTAAEMYGAAAIVASHSGFLERITAFGGLGFVTALTVAVTGVVALMSYHRSVTDSQLIHFARRFA
ncbi:hypothetical protein [Cryptosporangium sp. NPDC048952]|uniref:hypothetical protein n=1 Tax=Cryptosporangium sp. NPDC048952 TaxID=3363961 RepID=UPI00371FFB50